jgi:hypothetical protein
LPELLLQQNRDWRLFRLHPAGSKIPTFRKMVCMGVSKTQAMEELHQQPTVELTLLLKHETRCFCWAQRLLVCSCGCQCIVDIADGGNPDGDANLFVGKALGITPAVDPFIMVLTDIEDNPRHVCWRAAAGLQLSISSPAPLLYCDFVLRSLARRGPTFAQECQILAALCPGVVSVLTRFLPRKHPSMSSVV